MKSFAGWVPNITGNLSFSLVGSDGQPGPCEVRNLVKDGRRIIYAVQKRNLSDNAMFSDVEIRSIAIHKLYFTVIGRTGRYGVENISKLYGTIFIHRDPPLALAHDTEVTSAAARRLAGQLYESSEFAASFRLARNGKALFTVPDRFSAPLVTYEDNTVLGQADALRPLVAQCFYFLRDITHRHHHHSKRSDAITSVWSTDDPSRWVRETLYELHRRIIVSRRVRTPRGQEDALGILAYATSFENLVAGPFRTGHRCGEQLIPKYDPVALKESLNATLEVKRRRRTQRNVMAAAIPAFAIATLSLANGIVGKNATWKHTSAEWFKGFTHEPVTTLVALIGGWQWLLPASFLLGVLWIMGFTGLLQPAEIWPLRPIVQVVASKGRGATVVVFALAALCAFLGGLYLLVAA